MPNEKKSDQKRTAKRSEATLTIAEIRRARKKYKDLQLKLVKIRKELRDMMIHIPHCP
jgi:seryl-tRNA synthetase